MADQVLPLPKGGGALSGIGEKFAPDLHTGTGNLTIPIALPAGRNGFQPHLSLSYSSGKGNGPFGIGWAIDVPDITRKTSRGIPRYDDRNDVFLLSGAEDLVPVASTSTTVSYRPRTEGLFARIQHVRDATTDHWQVQTKDGLTSIYGTPGAAGQDAAVIANPARRADVFSWKLTQTIDTFGNRIEYVYGRDTTAVDGPHRWDQLYLRGIRYADYGDANAPQYLVSVRFVYEPRPDPFSEYRAGFEIRTVQRCARIEVATHADRERLSRRVLLTYLDEADPAAAPINAVSLLSRIALEGVDGTATQALPAMTLGYTAFQPHERTFAPVKGPELPPASLGHPQFEIADLFGRGLPDVFQMDGQGVRYWKNVGGAELGRPRDMKQAPAGLDLADPAVQLLDADGDGRVDLVVNRRALAGYFPLGKTGQWNQHGFRSWERAPTFAFESPEVKLVDLDGDGVVDALRGGTRFECFFNDATLGWHRTREVQRGPLDAFPNVSFSDPRVQLADMTGDGLQDIVMIHGGAVDYWPALGYGDFGARITMRNSPRLPFQYDPKRVLVGDVDGDGVADLVYVDDDRVTLWINRAGSSWSDPITISGTPPVTDLDSVRLVDFNGTGVRGVLWTQEPRADRRPHMSYLDFTGGTKPYLLDTIDGGMGAVTRVEYRSSVVDYLRDDRQLETMWKTSLPFPVQIVGRVTTDDQISHSRAVTEYRYHHGYWDGVEREFRGFGRVDTFDSIRFSDGPTDVPEKYFSPPTETRTWFHAGPVGDAEYDWDELDLSGEYWSEDPSTLPRPAATAQLLATLPHRQRRDAVRALRGFVLRTELYAHDPDIRYSRPYTVTETRHGVRQEPAEGAILVFFPFVDAARTTQWERGHDPLTRLQFASAYDEFGQPGATLDVAAPRGLDWRTGSGAAVDPYLITFARTRYAQPTGPEYIVDRPAIVTSMEIVGQTAERALPLRTAIESGSLAGPVFAETLHYYDGSAFTGLALGSVGAQGARTRTEELTLSDAQVNLLGKPPYLDPTGPAAWTADYPPEFRTLLPPLAGYVFHKASSEITGGYYSKARLTAFDFQLGTGGRGLPLRQRDPLDHESSIVYDAYSLLPRVITDPVGNQTQATYDYRTLQPAAHTDANENVSRYSYTPLGLLETVALMGKPGESVGDTPAHPSIRYEYELSPFSSTGQPISIHTIRRVHHFHDPDVVPARRDDTLETYEFSDGLGRLVQTRTLAEEVVFDDPQYGDAGLPADQTTKGNSPVGRIRGPNDPVNVVVSGWQVYDNKGRIVEKYEPFFSSGWLYEPVGKNGLKIEMYYDPRGQLVRTVAPDGSERIVVYGVPVELTDPTSFVPTPWESYAYDANDNAGRTAPTASVGYKSHWNTPTSLVVDALGRTRETIERNGPASSDWYTTRQRFDIRGNLLSVVDTYGRTAVEYSYDYSNRALQIRTLDDGTSPSVYDASGNVIERRDARGALGLQAYDGNLRLIRSWARDESGRSISLRQRMVYGETAANAPAHNLRGRLHQHYDEAGLLTLTSYDFKGNLTEKSRRVISDDALITVSPQRPDDQMFYQVDWSATPPPALELTSFDTSRRYDALNRVFDTRYPRDVKGQRRRLQLGYNRSGALESISFDRRVYVDRIAYNARGQRSLIAYGNGTITRYAYDPQTYRLKRLRTERYDRPTPATYQLTGQPLQDFAYDRDLVGNILGLHDRTPENGLPGAPDALDRTFGYDPVYRLTFATGRECDTPSNAAPWTDLIRCATGNATRPYSESYTYDDVGNFQSLGHVGGPTGSFSRAIALRPNTNQLQSVTIGATTYSYEYDAAGNLIRENGSRRLHWDASNRLRAFAEEADNAAPTLHAQYLYDAAGERTKKLVRTGPNRWDVTIYIDGSFEHHREHRSGSVSENDEVQISDRASRIAAARSGPTLTGDAFPNVRDGILYYLGDHLQSTNLVVDDGGVVVNSEEYTPYGETSFGSVSHKRFRFTGKERDEESSLYYVGARYLIVWLARWATTDPAGSKDGFNPYAYVRNNPVKLVDPTGKESTAPPTTQPPEPEPSQLARGKRLHEEILETYRAAHPNEVVVGNTRSIKSIFNRVQPGLGGFLSKILPGLNLKPDVLNLGRVPLKGPIYVYEAKPYHLALAGFAEALMYVAILKAAGFDAHLGPAGAAGTSGVSSSEDAVWASPVRGLILYSDTPKTSIPEPKPVVAPQPQTRTAEENATERSRSRSPQPEPRPILDPAKVNAAAKTVGVMAVVGGVLGAIYIAAKWTAAFALAL